MSATYEDRYGLSLSAHGREAAEHYMEGIDRALALTAGAQASLEAAIAADADFAMAHIALAREFQYRGNITAAQASKSAALRCIDGVTRRERQHIEALARSCQLWSRRSRRLHAATTSVQYSISNLWWTRSSEWAVATPSAKSLTTPFSKPT